MTFELVLRRLPSSRKPPKDVLVERRSGVRLHWKAVDDVHALDFCGLEAAPILFADADTFTTTP